MVIQIRSSVYCKLGARGHMTDYKNRKDPAVFQYDVCLSFAGEQRPYVRRVAAALRRGGMRVFFDEYETVTLWGKDLYAHLDDVYRHQARYCILFASEAFAAKVWTNHERRSAQARALKANQEYILPARFDDTPIPGLPETVHCIDLRRFAPERLAQTAIDKIGHRMQREYLPPVPDRLYRRLRIWKDKKEQGYAYSHAHSFLAALRRMSPEEQQLVLKTLLHGCPAELPDNVHINIDLLRRVTSTPPPRIKRVMGGLQSLGFVCSIREERDSHEDCVTELGQSEMLQLEWLDLHDIGGRRGPLLVAREMTVGAVADYCEAHGWPFLERLDFSQLATATATKDTHRRRPTRRSSRHRAAQGARKTRRAGDAARRG